MERKDKQKDGKTDKQKDGVTDKQKDGETDKERNQIVAKQDPLMVLSWISQHRHKDSLPT